MSLSKTIAKLMCVIFALSTLSLFSITARAQSSGQNYIQTLTPRISGLTTNAQLVAADTNKSNVETTISYMDGLGRPLQTVQKQASPSGYDVIQPVAYDQYGREYIKYMPYS